MALVNTNLEEKIDKPKFSTTFECIDYFITHDDEEEKIYAIEVLSTIDGGLIELINFLYEEDLDQKYVTLIGAILGKVKPTEDIVDRIFEILESENSYTRNVAITVLQEYGEALDEYLPKYINSADRDVRIFIANILGDTKLKNSRKYLLKMISDEDDINVLMTAADYLNEIGLPEDKDILISIKEKFKDEPYVSFAIDNILRSIGV